MLKDLRDISFEITLITTSNKYEFEKAHKENEIRQNKLQKQKENLLKSFANDKKYLKALQTIKYSIYGYNEEKPLYQKIIEYESNDPVVFV